MKIFRRIRHKLIFDNKKVQYLKYALGEIVLVVIGILIALQINNWNQKRINKNTEQIYLNGLKQEFQTSKLKLEELIKINKKNYSGAKKIIELSAKNNDSIKESSFSKLLVETFSDDVAFNSNNSLLVEMINSGNLKNLSNTELRKQLTNWISTLEDISRQEEELSNQRIKVLDIFRTDKYSLNTIFQQAGVSNDFGLPKTEKQVNNLSLLKSREFENNIILFIITSIATEKSHYKPLLDDLNSILKLINNEID
ncbi:MAG: hypothetical protein KDC74_08490 [Flavobacteriaceae bacterium]|nr:hypothetical protein [Nanoarchaeota archaeon]MCB0460037.1 hypothetical protein [Flavobacteriaceae bacterium]